MTSSPRAFASAISATLVLPQSTVTMTRRAAARRAASSAASDSPWPSSSRLGTYGSTVDAEPAQRQGHDREPGQPVGVEVAEDQDPLAAVARRVQTASRSTRRRPAAGRVVQAVERVREPGGQVVRASDTPRAARSDAERGPRPRARGRRGRGRGGRPDERGKRPAEAGLDHGVRMPRGAAPRIYRPGASARPQEAVRRTRGAAGRGRRGRAGGRPRAASRRAAGRDEDRRVGSRDDPDQQGQDEVADRGATEEQQREERQHHGQAGHDRAAEGLQDRVVDDRRRTARRRGAPCSRGCGRTRRSCRARRSR